MNSAFQPSSIALALFLLGIITYAYRFSFLSQKGSQLAEKIPPKVLKFLGPATFSAVIANNLINIKSDPHDIKLKMIAILASLVVAGLTKSILFTLIFGLGLLFALQTFISQNML
jgi:branched-subunit amino acid transport protein